jgi:hypothetical protein
MSERYQSAGQKRNQVQCLKDVKVTLLYIDKSLPLVIPFPFPPPEISSAGERR